jgi:hypothetical protein
MKRALVLALLLAGCVDAQQSERRQLGRYEGRDISELILQWGPPESVIPRPEGPVYTFAGSAIGYASTSSTTSGIFGNRPILATTSGNVPVTQQCRINAYTDGQNRIIGFRYTGSNGACADMYDRLH